MVTRPCRGTPRDHSILFRGTSHPSAIPFRGKATGGEMENHPTLAHLASPLRAYGSTATAGPSAGSTFRTTGREA